MGIGEVDARAIWVLGTNLTIGFPTRRLDADNLRAMISHHHGEMRAGQKIRKVENADACEFHESTLHQCQKGHPV